jgi:hypothetical protein
MSGAFDGDAYDGDAFDVGSTPPQAGGAVMYHYRPMPVPLDPDEEEALLLIMMGILND